MPNDKPKKGAFQRRPRSSADSDTFHARFAAELPESSILPDSCRTRLYDHFRQIEKEFEILYAENYQLKDQLSDLHEQLDTQCGLDKDSPDTTDKTHGAANAIKKSGSQISQKIKTTYKTSTSKLVSTFKSPTVSSHLVRKFEGHTDGIWEVNVSKDGPVKVLGTASADNTARLWDTETGRNLVIYKGHSGSVNSIRFHPTDDLIVTASGDCTAQIWKPQLPTECSSDDDVVAPDFENGLNDSFEAEPVSETCALLPLLGHKGVVIAADWLATDHKVITASWDRTAILFDAETGEVIQTLSGHDLDLTDVHTHPSHQLVVTSSKDTSFRLWDFRGPNHVLSVFQGHGQTVTTAVFVGSDKVVSGSDDRCIKVWDLKNMHSPLSTIRTDSGINRLSISSNQSTIAVPHDNRHIRLYDINGVRIGRLPRSSRRGHSRMVCSTAWNKDENSSCNLFSCGFDSQLFGWKVSQVSKEGKNKENSNKDNKSS